MIRSIFKRWTKWPSQS